MSGWEANHGCLNPELFELTGKFINWELISHVMMAGNPPIGAFQSFLVIHGPFPLLHLVMAPGLASKAGNVDSLAEVKAGQGRVAIHCHFHFPQRWYIWEVEHTTFNSFHFDGSVFGLLKPFVSCDS